jgi:hypothetical protein
VTRSEYREAVAAVVQMFKDAKLRFERTNAGGVKYSLAEDGYKEFIHWHDMPWE